VFNTKLSYFNNNEDTIKKFTKAINKGLEFTLNNDSKTIAEVIKNQFPDNNIEELEIMIDRYKKADAWWENTFINEEAFLRLEDLMKYNGSIKNGGFYNSLVKNDFNE